MNKKLFGAALAFVVAAAFMSAAQADDNAVAGKVTFTKDVMPILQENCQNCHRAQGMNLGGMIAPMSLMDYQETRPWAKSIAKAVSTRYMPPWHVTPEQHGVFEGERTLTDREIKTIVTWVETGAARGNPQDAPPARTVPTYDGWAIGQPDLIVRMPEPYFVADDVEDLYVRFETTISKEQMPEDRWIKAVEIKASSTAVHHVIARPLGGIAPGYQPKIYKEGYGQLLRAGAKVTFQMHYHKEKGPGTGVWDQTEIAVRFQEPGAIIKHVTRGDSLAVRGFRIPPNDPNYAKDGSYTFESDSYITGFNPHMHLRGKAARAVATFPDGTEKLLLDVPRYDFNWQTTYMYREPVFAPRGTKVDLTLSWDNSADNPANPDPTKWVTFGRPTTAEMGFGWMKFIKSEPVHIVVGEESSKPPAGGQ